MTYYIDLSYEDIATNLHRRFATQDAPFSDTFGDTSASERAVDQANVAGFSRNFQQKEQRRAGDSNPQPLAGHLISNQTMTVKQVPNTLRIARSDPTVKWDSALVWQQGPSFLDSSLDTWFQTLRHK